MSRKYIGTAEAADRLHADLYRDIQARILDYMVLSKKQRRSVGFASLVSVFGMEPIDKLYRGKRVDSRF